MPNILTTKRLELIACTFSLSRALFAGEKKLAARLDLEIAPGWSHFGLEPFRYAYRRVEERPDEEDWWSYFIVLRENRLLIGSGGYKGPPNRAGEVEIGYEIAEVWQNQGLATEAAQALIDHAFQFPVVRSVRAHTLAEENASGRVLQKCGLRFVHTLFDPEDGDIWLWELRKD